MKNIKFVLLAVITGVFLFNLYRVSPPAPVTEPAGGENEIIASGYGFGGEIKLKITLDSARKVQGIEVLSWQETEEYTRGLDKFLGQFKGRFLAGGFSLGDDIQAMSQATVTSRALVDIVNSVNAGARGNNMSRGELFLVVWAIFALILSFLTPRFWIRFIFVCFSVVCLGFIFDLVFSSYHLGLLLRGVMPRLIYWLPLSLTVVLGPFWCFWLCPFGAAQEIAGRTPLAKGVSPPLARRAGYIRYVFLVLFVIVLFFKRDYLFRFDPLTTFFRYSRPAKLLGGAMLFFSIFFFRFWCRYFCVCGAFFSLLGRIAPLKRYFFKKYKVCYLEAPASDKDCPDCGLCRLSPSDNLFKIFLAGTIFLIVISVFSSGFFPKPASRGHLPSNSGMNFDSVDEAGIRKMIDEGTLSGREAMFYSRREDSAPGE